MLVMDAMAEILKREGIDTLFCFPTTPIIEAAVGAGIRPIICRQERVWVDMANGFAKTMNGRPPAAFAMQYGPGAENAFPGIATAFVATIYGVGLANLLLLPIASKLKSKVRAQAQLHEMVIEGVISIAEGENPRNIETKIRGFVSEFS